MDVLQQLGKIGQHVADHAHGLVRGRNTACLYVSNGTDMAISVAGEAVARSGKVVSSFNQLLPGRAGCVRFCNTGAVDGTVVLEIAGQKLTCQASNSRMSSAKVDLRFEGAAQEEASPIRRSNSGSAEINGSNAKTKSTHWATRVSRAEGDILACVTRVMGDAASGAADFAAHVLITYDTASDAEKASPAALVMSGNLHSDQFLRFASWCHDNAPTCLGAAVFLMELDAAEAGLDGLDNMDQAFMLNLLVRGFLTSGVVAPLGLSFEAESQLWRTKVPAALADHENDELVRYDVFRKLGLGLAAMEEEGSKKKAARRSQSGVDEEESSLRVDMEAYCDAAVVLLKTVALMCIANSTFSEAYGKWAKTGGLLESVHAAVVVDPTASTLLRNSTDDSENFRMLHQHLKGSADAESGKTSMEPGDPEAKKANLEEIMMALVRGCIHDASQFALTSDTLFEALGKSLPLSGRAALVHYHGWIPGAKRSFASDEAEDLLRAGGPAGVKKKKGLMCCSTKKKRPKAVCLVGKCVALGSEVFAGLDEGRAASSRDLLASLGREAPPFRVLSTNSKSGEFFFFSGDSRYLVKTVSAPEGHLLYRMLPGYQGHIRNEPRSTLVRFAGLYRVDLKDGQTSWITVMASVFEPKQPIHLSYDLKGSLHGRKKKEKEKVGKDQDWVEGGQYLQLRDDVRREFCAAQEQDAAFLMSYGVMDYSLLVGIHNLEDGAAPAGGTGWREDGAGIWAVGGKHLYFAGMIDFLISFDMKKQGEHTVRVLQGHGKDASCVDPITYARRNVGFIREHVAMPEDKAALDTAGTFGSLKVTVISAKDLVNADGFISKSDPYCAVDLGLLRVRTPTKDNDLNPVWNHTVTIPVDNAHKDMEVIFSIWDEDPNSKLQGNDDPLGRTSLPLQKVIDEKVVEINKALDNVKKGTLMARLEWLPLPEKPPAMPGTLRTSGGIDDPPLEIWV